VIDWADVIRRLEEHVRTDERRAATCEGKHRFATAVQAYEHGRGRRWAEQSHVYHCPYCSEFHVGRNGPPKRSYIGYLRGNLRMIKTRERR